MKILVKKGEFYPRLIEGVADKYAEREFHIPDEDTKFEKKYNTQNIEATQKDKIVYEYKIGEKVQYEIIREKTLIIKNPSTLNNMHGAARAVIDKEGNLYVCSDLVVTHTEIIKTLVKIGLLEEDDLWWWKIPAKFATIQRVFDSKNEFFIGPSNHTVSDEIDEETRKKYNMPTIKESKKYFALFFKKAKQKNPQYKFLLKSFNELYRNYEIS